MYTYIERDIYSFGSFWKCFSSGGEVNAAASGGGRAGATLPARQAAGGELGRGFPKTSRIAAALPRGSSSFRRDGRVLWRLVWNATRMEMGWGSS